MNRNLMRLVAHTTAAALLALTVQAGAADEQIDTAPSAEAMTFDLFVLRPLALACTVVGTAVYIVALPFNILTLNVIEPGRRLVVEPAKFTFTRDLGDLDND